MLGDAVERSRGPTVAWTYLAVLATWALWHARPASPVGVGVLTAMLAVGTLASLWFWGADADAGWMQGRAGQLLTARGSPTAPVAVLGWAVVALGSLVAARRDPRPVLATSMMLPLVLLHPPAAGPTGLGIGALAVAILLAAVAAPRVAGAR